MVHVHQKRLILLRTLYTRVLAHIAYISCTFYLRQFNGSHHSNTQKIHKMGVRHQELAHSNMTLRPKRV